VLGALSQQDQFYFAVNGSRLVLLFRFESLAKHLEGALLYDECYKKRQDKLARRSVCCRPPGPSGKPRVHGYHILSIDLSSGDVTENEGLESELMLVLGNVDAKFTMAYYYHNIRHGAKLVKNLPKKEHARRKAYEGSTNCVQCGLEVSSGGVAFAAHAKLEQNSKKPATPTATRAFQCLCCLCAQEVVGPRESEEAREQQGEAREELNKRLSKDKKRRLISSHWTNWVVLVPRLATTHLLTGRQFSTGLVCQMLTLVLRPIIKIQT